MSAQIVRALRQRARELRAEGEHIRAGIEPTSTPEGAGKWAGQEIRSHNRIWLAAEFEALADTAEGAGQ